MSRRGKNILAGAHQRVVSKRGSKRFGKIVETIGKAVTPHVIIRRLALLQSELKHDAWTKAR